MITAVNERTYEYYGLSTDTKPVAGVGNGSIFVEEDTSTVYIFDQEHQTWRVL